MKVLIVYWHPEPRSFNGAMFRAASEAMAAAGHEVRTSDLHEMGFDPVSSRKNFTTVKDPDYLKLQIEEMNATETNGFSPEVEAEIAKVEEELTKVNAKLADQSFIEKVPAAVLDDHRQRHAKWSEKLETLKSTLKTLG